MPTSASSSFRKEFDYTSLDPATSQFIQQQTGEIRVLMKRTAQGIVEIGQKLIAVKDRLEHGHFLDWLAVEFSWHRDTANKFMHVATQFGSLGVSKFSTIAPSALYLLAAPSTPAAVREEAIARATVGESITYTAAKQLKQKYATPPSKSPPQAKPALAPLPPQSASKLEIVAIHPQQQVLALAETASVGSTQATQVLPPSSLANTREPSSWWRLGERHLLYCGAPDAPEFLRRMPAEVQLLLAFSPTPGWQSAVQAKTTIALTTRDAPQGNDLRMFEDLVELTLLLYSQVGDLVVSCFLPSPEVLSVLNRLERRGLMAEPDPRRVYQTISDWKQAGLKAERIS